MDLIRVEDRMPDQDDLVLILAEWQGVPFYHIGGYGWVEGELGWWDDATGHLITDDVTHWAVLPTVQP